MSSMVEPPDGDRNRGPGLVVMCWVQVGVAVAVVGLRFWGRIMIKGLGYDDFMMLLTLILFIGFCSFLTYVVSLGGFRHMYYLSPEARLNVVKFNWISQPWCIMGFVTGKISVALLINRLMGPGAFWRKWSMIVVLFISVIISVLNCIFTFIQCRPTRALWTPSLISSGQAHCWNPTIQSNFAIFLSSLNVSVDFFFAVLPVTIFWNLKMALRKKVALSALLGLGLLAAVFAAIKTSYLLSLRARDDFSWDTYDLLAWSAAELFIIIVCGSVPPIKPVWNRYVPKSKWKTLHQRQQQEDVFSTRMKTSSPGTAIQVTRSWNVSTTDGTFWASDDSSR